MPAFDFKCKQCGHVFEELILDDKKEIRCPKCGSNKIERIIASFNLGGKEVKPANGSCSFCRIKPFKSRK